jgi:DNA-binding MarR family transcriptional regulator
MAYAKRVIFGNMTADAMMSTDAWTTDRLDCVGEARSCTPGSMVLMSRLAKQFYRRGDERQLGMQLRHLVALSYVSDHDRCPQQDLADAFCMDANNVVLLLNELEGRGHIARRRDPKDRRRHIVEITPTGRRALTRAERAQESIEDDILQALDGGERAELWRLLTRALYGSDPQLAPELAAATGA